MVRLPDGAQYFLLVTNCDETTNAKFLFVHKIKMIGIILNVVYRQVHKNIEQRRLTGFMTIALW